MSDNRAISFDPAVAQRAERQTLSVEDLAAVTRYAKALLDGVALPEQVDEDFPEFFHLVDTFVGASGSARLRDLCEQASLFEGWGEDPLTDDDRVFLVRLVNETKDARHERQSNALKVPR